LTAHRIRVSEPGFAPGNGVSYVFTGSRTVVGTEQNSFRYTWNEGTRSSDYRITVNFGTLTVTALPEDARFEVHVSAGSGSVLYDGEEHSVSGFEQTSFIVNGVTYEVSGLRSEAAGTHAADSAAEIPVEGTAVVKDAEGNDVAWLYKWNGSGEEGDDLYFNVTLGETTYSFLVESYLCDKDSDVYKAVKALTVGAKVNVEGFLYWYNAPQMHVTKVTVIPA
jgi:hypothetical protein